MRVLYVALTRAINKMYIVGKNNLSERDIKKLKTQDYLKLNSFMDWILSILMEDKIMEDFSDGYYLTNEFSHGNLKINKIEELDQNKDSDFTNIYDFLSSDSYNKSQVIKLAKILDKTYPYEEDTKVSVKNLLLKLAKISRKKKRVMKNQTLIKFS